MQHGEEGEYSVGGRQGDLLTGVEMGVEDVTAKGVDAFGCDKKQPARGLFLREMAVDLSGGDEQQARAGEVDSGKIDFPSEGACLLDDKDIVVVTVDGRFIVGGYSNGFEFDAEGTEFAGMDVNRSGGGHVAR